MWAAVIAVIGTLAGGTVTALTQGRAARAARRADQAQADRDARLQAVTSLASAIADHRRAMWVREDARLGKRPAAEVAALREASHETRAAITVPLTTVRILAPELAGPARAAAGAAYALRNAPDLATLGALREAAVQADGAFIEAATLALA
jgi:hypothetical protein